MPGSPMGGFYGAELPDGAADPPIVFGGACDGTGMMICWPSAMRFGSVMSGFAAISWSRVSPWSEAIFDNVSPAWIT